VADLKGQVEEAVELLMMNNQNPVNRYKPAKREEVKHDRPKTILAKLRALEEEIGKDLNELEWML
jgi:ABC-type hemin transport system substrate-binding protein